MYPPDETGERFALGATSGSTVWVVSELYYPEEISTGYILTRIAESLAGKFTLRVLCGPPGYGGGASHFLSTERRNGVFIERSSIPDLDKNKPFARVARAVLLSLSLFCKALLKIRRSETVLVVTNPIPLFFLMAVVCRLKGARLLILVHDVFPENMVAAGMVSRDSRVRKLLSRLVARAYRAAHGVVVLGRDMEELIDGKLGGSTGKVTVIENWADTEDILPHPREQNPLIAELGLQDRFIVQFCGNLGRVQGLDHLLAAAELLAEKPVQFMFIGSGSKRELVESRSDGPGAGNITCLGSQPRDQQSRFLNACDVGLVSLAPGMYGLGVPSKSYNIMAAGKPIIAVVDEGSEIGRMVREMEIGWVVPPGDPVRLAAAILEARSDAPRLKAMGERARLLAETRYSFRHVATSYAQLMERTGVEPAAASVCSAGQAGPAC